MGLFWIEATRRRANSRVGAPPERGAGGRLEEHSLVQFSLSKYVMQQRNTYVTNVRVVTKKKE